MKDLGYLLSDVSGEITQRPNGPISWRQGLGDWLTDCQANRGRHVGGQTNIQADRQAHSCRKHLHSHKHPCAYKYSIITPRTHTKKKESTNHENPHSDPIRSKNRKRFSPPQNQTIPNFSSQCFPRDLHKSIRGNRASGRRDITLIYNSNDGARMMKHGRPDQL